MKSAVPSEAQPPNALSLYDDINLSLNACEDLTAILRFSSEVAGQHDLGDAIDLSIWRGLSRIHELIGDELADAHGKTTELYELLTGKGGAR